MDLKLSKYKYKSISVISLNNEELARSRSFNQTCARPPFSLLCDTNMLCDIKNSLCENRSSLIVK